MKILLPTPSATLLKIRRTVLNAVATTNNNKKTYETAKLT